MVGEVMNMKNLKGITTKRKLTLAEARDVCWGFNIVEEPDGRWVTEAYGVKFILPRTFEVANLRKGIYEEIENPLSPFNTDWRHWASVCTGVANSGLDTSSDLIFGHFTLKGKEVIFEVDSPDRATDMLLLNRFVSPRHSIVFLDEDWERPVAGAKWQCRRLARVSDAYHVDEIIVPVGFSLGANLLMEEKNGLSKVEAVFAENADKIRQLYGEHQDKVRKQIADKLEREQASSAFRRTYGKEIADYQNRIEAVCEEGLGEEVSFFDRGGLQYVKLSELNLGEVYIEMGPHRRFYDDDSLYTLRRWFGGLDSSVAFYRRRAASASA